MMTIQYDNCVMVASGPSASNVPRPNATTLMVAVKHAVQLMDEVDVWIWTDWYEDYGDVSHVKKIYLPQYPHKGGHPFTDVKRDWSYCIRWLQKNNNFKGDVELFDIYWTTKKKNESLIQMGYGNSGTIALKIIGIDYPSIKNINSWGFMTGVGYFKSLNNPYKCSEKGSHKNFNGYEQFYVFDLERNGIKLIKH